MSRQVCQNHLWIGFLAIDSRIDTEKKKNHHKELAGSVLEKQTKSIQNKYKHYT